MKPLRTLASVGVAWTLACLPAQATSATSAPLLPSWALQAELKGLMTSDVSVRLRDRSYVVMDHAWLRDRFLPYFRGYLVSLHIRPEADGMDCDNYTDLLRSQLVVANVLAGGSHRGDVPCATALVRPEKAFARIPAGGLHALLVIRTDRGWYVLEPQTSALRPLLDYPNLSTVESVEL